MELSSFFKKVFGSAKKTTNELIEYAENAIVETKIAAQPYVEKAEYIAIETINKAIETTTPIVEKTASIIEETSSKVKEVAHPYLEKAESFLEDTITKAKDLTHLDSEKKDTLPGKKGDNQYEDKNQ